MTPRTARLDLITETGRKLVAELRSTARPVPEAAVVRVFSPDRPDAVNLLRVSVLREMLERIGHWGHEDNDPLSVGRGNITLMLAWIDEMGQS